MRKPGKITVKHYLNKRAKPKLLNGKKYFPLYIQIIVDGHKAQIRSKIQEYIYPYRGYIESYPAGKDVASLICKMHFTEDLFSELQEKKVFPFANILNDEIHLVTFIIDSGEPFINKDFTLLRFSQIFCQYLRDIYEVLEEEVKKTYLSELNTIFDETSNCEDNRKLFKLTNYFIHFMNWSNNFCDFYEMTYEMLPSEIKYVENHLSDDLKVQIKAMMAFHARENYLRRYMGKTEKGLFPAVHIIDWQEKGREFISREFITIFGKQKALEYIETLDVIMSRNMEPAMII